jgi:hypothetical protein
MVAKYHGRELFNFKRRCTYVSTIVTYAAMSKLAKLVLFPSVYTV